MNAPSELVMAYGEAWLMLLADVAPECVSDPRLTLAHNMKPAIGALAVDNDTSVLRAVILLPSLTIELLDRFVDAVAREAILVRRAAMRGDRMIPAEHVVLAD